MNLDVKLSEAIFICERETLNLRYLWIFEGNFGEKNPEI